MIEECMHVSRIMSPKKCFLVTVLLLKKLLLVNLEQVNPKRRCWVHPPNFKHEFYVAFHQLVLELRQFESHHLKYLHMTVKNFDHLLSLVFPRIKRQDSVKRKAIEPELKLMVTLHHLAEGSSQSNIAMLYQLGRRTVSSLLASHT